MKLLFSLGLAALLASAPATSPGTITGPGHAPPLSVAILVSLDAPSCAGIGEVTLRYVPVPAPNGTLNLTILRTGEKTVIAPLPPRGEPVPGLSAAQNAAVKPVLDWQRRALLHGILHGIGISR